MLCLCIPLTLECRPHRSRANLAATTAFLRFDSRKDRLKHNPRFRDPGCCNPGLCIVRESFTVAPRQMAVISIGHGTSQCKRSCASDRGPWHAVPLLYMIR
jgi:hypothetical protein